MNSVSIWVILIMIIIIVIWLVSSSFKDTEESIKSNKPYECGIDLLVKSRTPFCMHFFLVAILFLIFDIEFVISIPLMYMHMSLKYWLMFWYLFFVVLQMGLVIEIFFGSLQWKL